MKVRKDWRCVQPGCGCIFESTVEHIIDFEICPECGQIAERTFIKGVPPGIIFRDSGWNMHPDDPKYSILPEKPREVHSWQMGRAERKPRPKMKDRG